MIGITFPFDLFHSGLAMLKEAKSNVIIPMVGLQTDPTIDRPEKINQSKVYLKDMCN